MSTEAEGTPQQGEQRANLPDLTMPVEIELSAPTRYEIFATRSSTGGDEESQQESKTFLRVMLSDFGSTSIEDFQKGAVATMKRALLAAPGALIRDDNFDHRSACVKVWAATVAFTTVVTATISVFRNHGWDLIVLILCVGCGLIFVLCSARICGSNPERESFAAVGRMCRKLVNGEIKLDSEGRMPVVPVDLTFRMREMRGDVGSLYITWTELATIRLIQLLKYADVKATAYLTTSLGQALVEKLGPAEAAAGTAADVQGGAV